jgi:hypothetical protein
MRRLVLITTVVSSLLSIAAASASAEALSPWWHLHSTTDPTYLQPSTAREQVYRLTVSATAGEVTLQLKPHPPYGTVPVSLPIRVGETPEEVVSAFEGAVVEELPSPGPLTKVTATPGPYGQDETYEITVVSEADIELSVSGTSLTGGPAKAEVQQVSEERLDGEVVVMATNLGDAIANPAVQPVTVADKLPPGIEAVAIEGAADENFLHAATERTVLECSLQQVSCTFTGKAPVKRRTPTVSLFVAPYEQIEMRVWVKVTGAETGAVSEASITGGGAPPASARQALTVSDAPVPFGASTYEMAAEEVGGRVDTQAGSHPFQFTTTYGVNSETAGDHVKGQTKDLSFDLPPGFVGNPTPFPQCKLADFLTERCPLGTVVGVSRFGLRFPIPGFESDGIAVFKHLLTAVRVPLYNLEPAVGEPARFGFIFQKTPVLLTTSVRTGSDYGVTVTVKNITQAIEFLWNEVTFWGVPGDERHNQSRGEACLLNEAQLEEGVEGTNCPTLSTLNPPPLLSMPTSCTGPLRSTVVGDSWEEPLRPYEPFATTVPIPAMDGCNRLPFEPSLRVTPDGTAGSTPTGLTVDVHVNQDSVLNSKSLAGSDVRGITVALPEGVAINPAGGGGLEACSEGLIGFEGVKEAPLEPGVSNATFTSSLPEPLQSGLNFCANASKIGTVTIHTPLLPNPLEGAVYLASQEANPFGSLVAMYLVARDPVSGTLVKLPGVVRLSETGQIVATFENNPQLPFEDAELHFFGGERAPLASPSHCGAYTSQASFTPWTGSEPVSASSSFEVKSGPNGGPCPGASLPFSPSLTAGTTSIQAGGFSPFTMTMSRADGSQHLQAVELKLPEGLSGLLSGVELCPESQASQGSCGPNSLIGETTVSVGVGGSPFTVSGGRVYITGPYDGAPFGLLIVNPAKAGPYDLADTKGNHPPCDCVLVRAKIEVNPITAALTVTSDDSGPYKIPTSIEGIPLQIQHVNVTIGRPGFTFNPTNCNKTAIGGALSSAEGATQALSVPFQATNCATLKFTPKFAVATSGKNSKAYGTSLAVKLTYPSLPFGSEANIKQVKVELPRQLPSRLTTLQKACTAAQFNANPAGCPSESVIGHAKAVTPLIPVPLEGPAYFVSNGGEAFPNLIIVLQGYGVRIDLVGDTFISKAGVTSSTFKTVPDAPVGSFELVLPEGKYSALTALGNLCTEKLTMPTEFLAQSGVRLTQSTPVSVSGCAKKKALSRAQKLTAALKECKKKAKKKRAGCDASARKRYGPPVKKKSKGKSKG